MTDQKKPSFQKLKFPKGRAVFPWLGKPDTKFKAEGVYKVNIVLDGEAAAPLTATIDEATEKARLEAVAKIEELKGKGGKYIAQAKKKLEALDTAKPYEPVYDDEGNETGEVMFKFTMPASYKDKKTGEVKPIKPRIWDAKNVQVNKTKVVDIFSGSILKVNAELRPYYAEAADKAGVSMRPVDVQIIELVSGGGGTSPFEEEEGGYEFDESDAAGGFADDGKSAPANLGGDSDDAGGDY